MKDKTVFVYLSGSIPKGPVDKRDHSWDEKSIAILTGHLSPLDCVILNPALRSDDLSDFTGTFGRDLCQVVCSDFVLVDARQRRGLGVGAEMYLAKTQKIPVISIVPPDSHYRRRDLNLLGQDLHEWVHPFIWGLSDALVTDVTQAAAAIMRILNTKDIEIKDTVYCYGAIRHYLRTQLYHDVEMKRMLERYSRLQQQIEELLNETAR